MKDTMQNEPQLSAKMEKRFDEQKFELGEDAGGNPVYLSSDEFVSKQVKQFLATALEEQRSMFIEEVRNRRATIKWLWGKQKTDDECFLMVMEQVQRIAEFAKLNQLKEEE